MTPILKDIFKSTIKSLEILYVLEGAKPSARIMVSEKDEAQVEGFVSQKGLSYVKSNFKVVKQDKDKVLEKFVLLKKYGKFTTRK